MLVKEAHSRDAALQYLLTNDDQICQRINARQNLAELNQSIHKIEIF